ncbi:DUF4870 domain-containing protein [Entamoeba marina]
MTLVEESNPFDDGYVAPEPQDKSLPCALNILAILSTALACFGAIPIFFLEKKNQYIRLVSCQSAIFHLPLFFILFVLFWFMFINNWFFYTVFFVYLAIYALFTIFLVVMAIFRLESGDAFLVPGVEILVHMVESKF